MLNSGRLSYGSQTYAWSTIYRMNLTDASNPLPPSVTDYTLLSKKECFAIFWIILAIQTFVILVTKMMFSKPFRKLNWIEMIIHAMENTNLADPVEDWDMQKSGNCSDHYKRMKSVQKEVLAVIGINFFFNATMLTPLYILCKV